MKKYQSFLSEIFQFLEEKFSMYLYRHVFVMTQLINNADIHSNSITGLELGLTDENN